MPVVWTRMRRRHRVRARPATTRRCPHAAARSNSRLDHVAELAHRHVTIPVVDYGLVEARPAGGSIRGAPATQVAAPHPRLAATIGANGAADGGRRRAPPPDAGAPPGMPSVFTIGRTPASLGAARGADDLVEREWRRQRRQFSPGADAHQPPTARWAQPFERHHGGGGAADRVGPVLVRMAIGCAVSGRPARCSGRSRPAGGVAHAVVVMGVEPHVGDRLILRITVLTCQ